MHPFETTRQPRGKRLAAFLLAALLLLGCGRYTKIAPDLMIEGEGLRARIEFFQQCWVNCSTMEKITFHERWGKVGEDDYKKLLGLPIGLPPSGLIMFPKRKSFLTLFSATNGGTILAEIAKTNGELNMTPRAGCMDFYSATISRLGQHKLHRCGVKNQRSYATHFHSPGIIYPAFRISLHGGFWVDYQNESVHEMVPGAPYYDDMIGLGGLDASRQYLLALYKTDTPQHYKVCAFGGGVGKLASSRYCVEFDSDAPLDTEALRRASKPTMHSMQRVNAFTATEPLEVSKHHGAWLAQHVVFRPGESPFSSATGRLTLIISPDNVADFAPSIEDTWPAIQ